jgi:hypothetical protein
VLETSNKRGRAQPLGRAVVFLTDHGITT